MINVGDFFSFSGSIYCAECEPDEDGWFWGSDKEGNVFSFPEHKVVMTGECFQIHGINGFDGKE